MALEDLKRLAASRKDFSQYLSLCYTLEEGNGPVTFHLNDHSASASQQRVDKVSLQIIPDSYKEPFLPVRSTGDGNCLFNSASIAICDDKRLAPELQLRTSIELAVYRDFYREHPVLRAANVQFQFRRHGIGVLSMGSLFDLTCFSAESERVHGKEGFEAALRSEVMITSVNYQYSGILQIMGLASVVGVPIQTLFPQQDNRFLPVY